jgi:molybdopterin biosynthesis enzyme MoaB
MQLQVNPTNVGRRSQDVVLYDGGTRLTAIDRTITIFG